MKRMIFYHPKSLAENPRKGSELRPKKMKEAFEGIGYTIDLAVGDSSQRKISFNRIEKRIQEGAEYEFMYAESLNMPIPLADSHHLPLRPLQDFRFFRMIKKHSIPIGFFYRDLYWRVDELKKKVSYLKFLPKQIFHWIEWMGVVNTVDHLFVPTKSMMKYFPTAWPEKKLSALYPGCNPMLISKNYSGLDKKPGNNKLTLLYVGGVTPPYYDLTPLIEVTNELEVAELILCCRKSDWEINAHFYKCLDLNNINIVHANSTQIGEYYRQSDVFLDIRKPEGYLKSTIPIKIVESIGHEVPLLLMAGTESAEFVKKEDAGWIVDTVGEAKTLLEKLSNDKQKIAERVRAIQQINKNHTWENRAKKVSGILAEKNRVSGSLIWRLLK